MRTVGQRLEDFVRVRVNDLYDELVNSNPESRSLQEKAKKKWKERWNLLEERSMPLVNYEAYSTGQRIVSMREGYIRGVLDTLDNLGLDGKDIMGGIASEIRHRATGSPSTLSSQSGTSAA